MALEDPSQIDLLKPKNKPKYRNKRCVVEGVKFDSEKEARRWVLLLELERQGAIRNLDRQVQYGLYVNGVKICRYFADFVYEDLNQIVVEDVKSAGTRTRVFLIKKKMMKAIYGIDIKEV